MLAYCVLLTWRYISRCSENRRKTLHDLQVWSKPQNVSWAVFTIPIDYVKTGLDSHQTSNNHGNVRCDACFTRLKRDTRHGNI
mmetsp:Transcript_125424/g.234556  ORF Transcript_125424/g.234556 Transcript_125424/m.234556 type:complete len:83 (+) Transcript_125424:167-415(+)